MRILTFTRISLSSMLVVVALLMVGLIGRPVEAAQSIGPAQSIGAAQPTAPITDTRWLALIRSIEPARSRHQASLAQPSINVHLTDGLVAGRVSLASNVQISVTRAGNLVAGSTAAPFPDGGGYLYAASLGWYDYDCCLFKPGDVVWVMQAGASVSLTVPPLTALVDAPADEVYGVAPISQSVTAYLYPFVAPDTLYTRTVSADGQGQYQAIFTPTFDVRPRDSGYVAYAAAPDRLAYLRFAAPMLRAQADGAEIAGVAAPRSPVTLTMTQADGTPLPEQAAYSDVDGAFTAYGYSEQVLKAGATITAFSAGQTFSMTVMAITTQADLNSGVVSGEAQPNQSIEVWRFNGPINDWTSPWVDTPIEQVNVTATAAGHYTTALALARPNYGVALVTAPDGNQTYAVWVVPYITARLGTVQSQSYHVGGQVAEPFAPITLTVQGPSGYNKDVRSLQAGPSGAFDDYDYQSIGLDTGDVITVATPGGVQAALILPLLTGEIDPNSDTVSGQAPPGARLTFLFNNYSYASGAVSLNAPTGGGYLWPSNEIVVTATAQGDYFLDLYGVFDFDMFSTGEVFMTTAAGHTVSRVFGTNFSDNPCQPQLQMIYVGGNQVDFQPFFECPSYVNLTLRLRSAGGQLKALLGDVLYPYQWLSPRSFYTSDQPVVIRPGDVVELESHSPANVPPSPTPQPTEAPMPTATPWSPPVGVSDQFVTVTVPTLTVQLDLAANTVAGLAPANTIVSLQLSRNYWVQQSLTATVDAQGAYSVNLAGVFTLQAGDAASVIYEPAGGPNFQAQAALPALRARAYDSFVMGWLPPFTAYTLTLQTSRPITGVTHGTAEMTGQFTAWLAPIEPGDTVVLTAPQIVRRLTMPRLIAQVKRDTATIEGQAPPNSQLLVDLQSHGVSQLITATASGTYSVSFPLLAPATDLDGQLTYFDADGDQAQLDFSSAHWEITLDQACMYGFTDMSNTPITLTLRNSLGTFKSAFSLIPEDTLYSGCFTTTVQAEDRLVLTTLGTTQTFTVPLVTARHDYGRQVVTGLAPANHTVQAAFTDYVYPYYYVSRRTWVDASGRYGVDTSDLALRLQQTGSVVSIDDWGNTTTRNFTITGYQSFLPVMSSGIGD
jgi:hypothetical protein